MGSRTEQTEHAVEELQAKLGHEAVVLPGEVFTVRFEDDGGMSHYLEPTGIVLIPTGLKQKVYEIGEDTGQERFTVEDFTEGEARMVETLHGAQPDV